MRDAVELSKASLSMQLASHDGQSPPDGCYPQVIWWLGGSKAPLKGVYPPVCWSFYASTPDAVYSAYLALVDQSRARFAGEAGVRDRIFGAATTITADAAWRISGSGDSAPTSLPAPWSCFRSVSINQSMIQPNPPVVEGLIVGAVLEMAVQLASGEAFNGVLERLTGEAPAGRDTTVDTGL